MHHQLQACQESFLKNACEQGFILKLLSVEDSVNSVCPETAQRSAGEHLNNSTKKYQPVSQFQSRPNLNTSTYAYNACTMGNKQRDLEFLVQPQG